MYFAFRDQVFRQREGLPMSSSISGILGNHIHGKTRNHRPLLGPNDKPLQEIFLDDIYLQTTNEETADDFQHIINNVHPNLKFEIESKAPRGELMDEL